MAIRFSVILFLLFLSTLIDQTTYAGENENKFLVSSISIRGNTITNKKIILRELPFKIGDTLDSLNLPDLAIRCKANLHNTHLFNFITVNHIINGNQVEWYIVVEERWYIWPFPILEYEDRNLSSFIKNADLSRVNYGAYIKVDNFRGMREQIKLRLISGHRKQVTLQYITQNLDRDKRHGLSAWISYYTKHEVNYASNNNKPLYFKSDNGPARQVFFADLTYHFRPKHYWYHALTVGTLHAKASDALVALNPNYLGDENTTFWYNHITYEATLDKRNSKIFPLGGYLFRSELSRQGFSKQESLNHWYLRLTGGLYGKLANRVFAGSDVMFRASTQTNSPYFLNEAIGYVDFIRGYEHYVTNGSTYYINKNSLKFELLPTKVINLPLIPEGKLKKAHLAIYWSLFADTGYVKPDAPLPSNSLEGKMIFGYGTGLYIVAYYDIVFRVEYSFNGFGESGFFFHFGSPFLINYK
jgi:outer membrane protein assembly factor BamA